MKLQKQKKQLPSKEKPNNEEIKREMKKKLTTPSTKTFA